MLFDFPHFFDIIKQKNKESNMANDNKLISDKDMKKLESAVIFIPGTQEFNVWVALVNFLESANDATLRYRLAQAVTKDPYKTTISDQAIMKLIKTCLEAITNRQEMLSRDELLDLCRKHISAHNDTISKLNATNWEMNIWKDLVRESLVQAIDHARITARTTKKHFLEGIQALMNSKDPDPQKLRDVINGNTGELRKFYNVEKETR